MECQPTETGGTISPDCSWPAPCQRCSGQSRIVSMTFIKPIGVFGLFISIAVCQGQTELVVQGIGGKSVTLSVADLSNLPQQIVKATDHGTPATFEGVLLTDVLAKVDLPLGEKFHSTGASYYLTVEAKDGIPGRFRLGGTGLDVHGQVRIRGDEAGWQAVLGQRRPLSVGGAG